MHVKFATVHPLSDPVSRTREQQKNLWFLKRGSSLFKKFVFSFKI